MVGVGLYTEGVGLFVCDCACLCVRACSNSESECIFKPLSARTLILSNVVVNKN